jgi:cytidylate kinase
MCRDSIKLDTSNLSIEEVVAEMRRIVKEKTGV